MVPKSSSQCQRQTRVIPGKERYLHKHSAKTMEPQFPSSCSPNQPLCISPDHFYRKAISTMIHSKTLVAINSEAKILLHIRIVLRLRCLQPELSFFTHYWRPPPLYKISFPGNILLKDVTSHGRFLTFVTHIGFLWCYLPKQGQLLDWNLATFNFVPILLSWWGGGMPKPPSASLSWIRAVF